MIVYAGQPNPVSLVIMTKLGDPVTDLTGVVTFYLKALSGDHAGEWWDGSGWVDVETSAGAGTYEGGGTWSITIVKGAWVSGDTYTSYAESDIDIIPVGITIRVATCGELNQGFDVEVGVTKQATSVDTVDVDVEVKRDRECQDTNINCIGVDVEVKRDRECR